MTEESAKDKDSKILEINGWTVWAHSCFLEQLDSLVADVEALKQKLPNEWKKKNTAKRLKAIVQLAFDEIPQDPEKAEYRQGSTLGDGRKHWFRAKFFQQYRLFFRFHRPTKTIIFGWVNDDKTKRAYGSASDAYRVFGKTLDRKQPPDDWAALLAEATVASVRLQEAVESRRDLDE